MGLILIVAGCGPARPEKLVTPPRVHHEAGVPEIRGFAPNLSPAPDIAVPAFEPDFHDELRWPLLVMDHPSLEPRFAIAQELAQPGVGWVELCGRGITNRFGVDPEMLAYLRGWCSALRGDTDGACTNLVPLYKAKQRKVAAAVRADLANILANGGHADEAEHLINAHHISDVTTLDLLAANYVEVGTADDALAINRHVIGSDDYATAETKCIRLTKQIVLADDRNSPLMPQIEAFATQPKNPDPTCVREYHKLQCWARRQCGGFVIDQGGTETDATVVSALASWDSRRSSTEWWKVADTVTLIANEKPDAAPLAIAAMENAIELDRFCTDHSRTWVRRYDPVLRPLVTGEWLTRLDALVAKCR